MLNDQLEQIISDKDRIEAKYADLQKVNQDYINNMKQLESKLNSEELTSQINKLQNEKNEQE